MIHPIDRNHLLVPGVAAYLSGIEGGQERYRELLQKAEIERRAKKARADRPGLGGRFLLSTGDLLISLGLRLKKRYQAIGQHADLAILQAG